MIAREQQIQSAEFENSGAYKLADTLVIAVSLLFITKIYLNDIVINYFVLAGSAPCIFILIADSLELYRNQKFTSVSYKLTRITVSWTMTFTFIFVLAFFFKWSEVHSRVVIGAWLITVPAFLFTYRSFLTGFRKYSKQKSGYKSNAIIIGATRPGYRIARAVDMNNLEFKFQGIYDDPNTASHDQDSIAYPLRGNIDDALQLARDRKVGHVFIAMKPVTSSKVEEIIRQLSDTTAQVYLVPDIHIFQLMQSRWRNINGIPSISVHDTPFNGVSRLVKRIEDIALSLLILLFISPVLIFIALGVKLSSPGPVIFKQYRYGIDGSQIKVWKFRSMKSMDNGAVVKQATKGDARITKFGAFIRKTSLDELPQFINVLQGRMSIVGPRPHAVAHNEEYRQLVDSYMLRHKVKPGITGLAQVKGYRGETDTLDKMEKRVEYDLKYIRNWSLWLDLRIVFMTVFKGFVGKTAY